jgi:hypothetical protein
LAELEVVGSQVADIADVLARSTTRANTSLFFGER